MKASFRLFRIAGIEIGVHYTWVFALALIAWSLADGFFPDAYPGWDTSTYWVTGVVSALLLFVCVLVHELAHSLLATRFGYPVAGITLFIFGGVSQIRAEAEEPRHEFLIAAVGPAMSIVLSFIFWLIAGRPDLFWLIGGDTDPGRTPASAVIGYLAFINLLLGLFNLIPGFPLDGGRVLRAIVWRTTGSLERATNIAATIGQAFGWGFIAIGLLQLLGGNFLGGLWIAFIGWFLNGAAESSRRDTAMQALFSGLRVRMVMEQSPPTVAPSTSVDEVVMGLFLQGGRRAVLVTDQSRVLGIATVSDVRKLPQDRWKATRIDQVMTGAPLKTAAPDDDVAAALRVIAENDLNQLPVVEGGTLVGMLNRGDIVRQLQVRKTLGLKPGRPRSG
jgi:Zn-dependent protease/CBS domain-containing protein